MSTEDEEIAKVGKSLGANVPFIRPKHLSKDDSPEWDVWQHAAQFIADEKGGCEGIIVLPATAPLRTKSDVENCIIEYENTNADVVITVTEAHRNPYFNMVALSPSGSASPVLNLKRKVTRRQEAPEVFDMTTVAYILRPQHLLEASGLFQGFTRCVKVDKERAVDIDTLADFEFAEFLAHRNLASENS